MYAFDDGARLTMDGVGPEGLLAPGRDEGVLVLAGSGGVIWDRLLSARLASVTTGWYQPSTPKYPPVESS